MDHDVLNELKEHMKSDIQLHGKLNEDITEIKVSLARIDTTLERNTDSLEEHMRQTRLLEQKIAPVERHVAMMHGALKLIGIVSVVVGIITGIVQLMKGP